MGDPSRLVEEAVKKSGLLWLDLPGLPQPRAAWHLWHEGAVYIVTGGEGEQPLPGLPGAERVRVIVRSKDKGGRLVVFDADCSPVEPGTDTWDAVLPLLARSRLNAREGQIDRWAADSWVIRLTPDTSTVRGPGDHPSDEAAFRPVATPATTSAPTPRLYGAKKRRADR